MKRAIVIGCPGSGKSTFARALHKKTGIPLYYLDMLYWNADKTTVKKDVFLERLGAILEKECWIIDGNFSSTMRIRIEAADTVFFLDYETEICLAGVRARRGTVRADMPWVETEEDEEFMEYIKGFSERERPEILRLLQMYPDKKIVVFKKREDASAFLESLF
jgi:adenylate kinase family enzyme